MYLGKEIKNIKIFAQRQVLSLGETFDFIAYDQDGWYIANLGFSENGEIFSHEFTYTWLIQNGFENYKFNNQFDDEAIDLDKIYADTEYDIFDVSSVESSTYYVGKLKNNIYYSMDNPSIHLKNLKKQYFEEDFKSLDYLDFNLTKSKLYSLLKYERCIEDFKIKYSNIESNFIKQFLEYIDMVQIYE